MINMEDGKHHHHHPVNTTIKMRPARAVFLTHSQLFTRFHSPLCLLSQCKGEEFEDVMNEISLLERCKHDGIVAYFGSFVKNKTIWICMEFCGGGSVADAYAKLQRGLDEKSIAHITYQSLQALEYLHQAHLVHRDIKVCVCVCVEVCVCV